MYAVDTQVVAAAVRERYEVDPSGAIIALKVCWLCQAVYFGTV